MKTPKCGAETAEQLAQSRVSTWNTEDFYNYCVGALMEEFYDDEEYFRECWEAHFGDLDEVPEEFRKSIF